jgi:fructose-bisphosphate aldolase, class II
VGGAALAVNVVTLEQAEGVVDGATRAGRGVIIQLSENAIRFHGGGMIPLLLACRELADSARVPLSIHLDHLQDLDLVAQALKHAERCGVSSLMIDAAHFDWEKNVAVTAEVVSDGHAKGLWIEAELGVVGGKDGAHAPGVRTDPQEAAAFVAVTGVDALAVAVGSSHAMIDRVAVLDIELIARLRKAVPVPMVLHGSSGVPVDLLRSAVAAGIRKVNVGTALSVAFTHGVRGSLASAPESVDPRRYLAMGRDAVAAVVADSCDVVWGRSRS